VSGARFTRLAEEGRQSVKFYVNGEAVEALQGDTLLVAILAAQNHVRVSEFGDGCRAGFCLMGSCQDCWVRTETGERLKACATSVAADMRIRTDSVILK
jgi:predicted molibdopterin-dependent oxidoreductase YjgC